MPVASSHLVYPMTQLLTWCRLQSELGQKIFHHPYVAAQEPEVDSAQQEAPARSTMVVVSKLETAEKHPLDDTVLVLSLAGELEPP